MCIIVYKPMDVELPSEKTLRQCWKSNPHGGGLMYAVNGKLVVQKGMMEFETFYNAILDVPSGVDLVMHFRIASHGAINAENTHPWMVTDDIALVHNGVLHWCGQDKNVSDSYILSKKLSECVALLDNPGFRDILSAAIVPSKVIILMADGTIQLYGHHTLYEGCYYSNDSYKIYERYDWENSKQSYIFDELKKPLVTVTKATKSGNRVTLTYSNGGTEIMSFDRFLDEWTNLTYDSKLDRKIDRVVSIWCDEYEALNKEGG